MDKFYSPVWLAHALCEPFALASGMRVFDPTMGEGALLQAADQHCGGGSLRLLGCDIDSAAVREVTMANPEWSVDRADIYSHASRQRSTVWQSVSRDGVDVVVMNPPFSYRGRRRQETLFRDVRYPVTPALAALATVLNEVTTSQGVGIVLPEGSLHGEANEDVWSAIRSHFEITVVRKLPRGSFPDAKASSVLLTIKPQIRSLPEVPSREDSYTVSLDPARSDSCRCVEVVRGRVRNSSSTSFVGDDVQFVHTTDLREGEVIRTDRTRSSSLATEGPMLLLPRVGRFYVGKVVISDAQRLVLSDCVFGLRTRARQDLERLRSALLHPVSALETTYSGTGAPYATLRGLMAKLAALGFSPRHVPASQGAFECTCAAADLHGQTNEDSHFRRRLSSSRLLGSVNDFAEPPSVVIGPISAPAHELEAAYSMERCKRASIDTARNRNKTSA